MKALGLMLIATVTCTSAIANDYTLKKKQIRQNLIQCLDDPDHYNSVGFNQCIVQAGQQFKQAADLKMQRHIQTETQASIRQGWIKDRAIHHQAIKSCDNQTELNFQGYAYAAKCELKRSQDYYSYSMFDETPHTDWTTAQHVDALFIGY
ncbi:hypothetical protein [uncultured Acinetobacter sp.]|uniref:hypothetical protein n=1 Tax=uncultured Acinetobacter sp. TaxID=165433 RepID=UPI002630CCA4|nr:hypothetical protein [uncultured Acinetobacter sp.]